MTKLFSQRQAKPIERYSYGLPKKIRSRIFHTLRQLGGGSLMQEECFQAMLGQVGQRLLSQFGELKAKRRPSFVESVTEHWATCSDDEALDFIELCFQTQMMDADMEQSQAAVKRINTIFEEEGIGYELTPPAMVKIGKKATTRSGIERDLWRAEYPQIIKKGERTTHDHAVKPALEVLRDSRFATANSELLEAFQKVRGGKYAEAITSCGAAFESVLKTIYDEKGWPYDPDKDTCSRLVEVGRDKGLFWPFYAEILKGVGTIRNKTGDAHGKGPAPKFVAEREHTEHMIALTCSHITFLVALAGF